MNFDEILLIDKPAGMTSFGVVARIRRKLSEKAEHRVKVGHTGTLDPFATGLMVILAGKKTKIAGDYSKLDKVYVATIKLGVTSTTGDPEGVITKKISSRSGFCVPDQELIEQILRSFVGEITQTPPIYSAIKINGERAYKLARKGRTPKIPDRKVIIYELELVSYSYPDLVIRAHVSSGTYIRTLAEDIGKKLEIGAYTTELRRTKVGDFDIKNALSLAEYMNI